jgi:hypothetical protein
MAMSRKHRRFERAIAASAAAFIGHLIGSKRVVITTRRAESAHKVGRKRPPSGPSADQQTPNDPRSSRGS